MTKIEALKYLFEENIYELNRNTYLKDISIEFKGDEFTVTNKENKVVLKDKLSNYDLDFESQKRFILNIAEKVTQWFEVLEDLDREYFRDLIKVDNNYYYFDILGYGDIFKSAEYIEINIEEPIIDEIGYIADYSEDIRETYDFYYELMYTNLINDIKSNLDEDKIRVVYYNDGYKFIEGFYVDGTIKEDETYVCYIDDPDEINELKEGEKLSSITSYEEITLYYSLTTKEEIDNAVKFIKDLIEIYAEELVGIMEKIIEERKAKNSEETEETEVTEDMV